VTESHPIFAFFYPVGVWFEQRIGFGERRGEPVAHAEGRVLEIGSRNRGELQASDGTVTASAQARLPTDPTQRRGPAETWPEHGRTSPATPIRRPGHPLAALVCWMLLVRRVSSAFSADPALAPVTPRPDGHRSGGPKAASPGSAERGRSRPAFVPRTTGRREETTRRAEQQNAQFRRQIRESPRVARVAPRTLSRWRNGFKSRWDYEEPRRPEECWTQRLARNAR
jgi:hypothetical protein